MLEIILRILTHRQYVINGEDNTLKRIISIIIIFALCSSMSLSIFATNVPNLEGYPYTADNPYIVENLDWTKYQKDNPLSTDIDYKDLAALILGATKPKDLVYLVVKVVSTKSYAWKDSATGVHSGITVTSHLTRTLITVKIIDRIYLSENAENEFQDHGISIDIGDKLVLPAEYGINPYYAPKYINEPFVYDNLGYLFQNGPDWI